MVEEAQGRPVIYLIEGDAERRHELAGQLARYGYRALSFADARQALAESGTSPPAAVVADLDAPPEELALGVGELQLLSEAPPVLFLSGSGDYAARLKAVRFGASAFFPRPVAPGDLIDALDDLLLQRMAAPYRVLVCLGELDRSRVLVRVLENAGMLAERAEDPFALPDRIRRFGAELVLLDLYYPDLLGMELAALIRQYNELRGMPILFVSGETSAERRTAAVEGGGDETLPWPIEPGELESRVSARIERARTLQKQAVSDSLTGLLNHTALMDALQRELLRAEDRATAGSVAFAMIDIDHFRAVNEGRGHAAGDAVIRNLGRLLRQTLPRTASVGRYGGEEFGVVLPEHDREAARAALDRARALFAGAFHYSGGESFACTFSSGVAVYPTHTAPAALAAAADAALYAAKRAGRNRVECD